MMEDHTAALRVIEGEQVDIHEPKQQLLRPLGLREFLSMSIKPKSMVLAPVIPEKGLVMTYAPRGIGKTYLGLTIAYAVGSGGKALRWQAPTPRRTLYIDGEMPLAVLQERLAGIVHSAPETAPEDHFSILPADYFDIGLPNLATEAGQKRIEPLLDGVSFLVLDNLSTLAATARDNDAESWGPMQEWLLRLRRRGMSVLLIHHAGKGGQQRGTSRREEVLDTVISLRRPADYSPVEGARFEVHFEKARGLCGDDAKPFEAKLEVHDGQVIWTTRELADADADRVLGLSKQGLSVRDIAQETMLSKSKVHRILHAAKAE